MFSAGETVLLGDLARWYLAFVISGKVVSPVKHDVRQSSFIVLSLLESLMWHVTEQYKEQALKAVAEQIERAAPSASTE